MNKDTIKNYEKKFNVCLRTKIKSNPPKEGESVPIDRRAKSWYAWVSNPYEEGERDKDIVLEYSGLDYLIAYWLGRYHGFIDN
jgi:hypothetical protein